MPDNPVTRQEMQTSVDAAEHRGEKLVEAVVSHFDQRLKDSERVLTWRMVAVGGMTGVLTSLLDLAARGPDSAVSGAIAHAARILT